MSAEVWDAVVVGAGPAGSATAARLARLGHRVLLLDRESFPRPKPCGECLSPAAVDALRRLDALDPVRAQAHAAILGWRIAPVDGLAFQGDFPAPQPGIAISRQVLDQVLVEHACQSGAEVRTGVQVVDLVRQGEQVVGVRVGRGSGGGEIHARLVVGADGLRSVVVRRLGLIARAPRLRKLALTAHLEDVRGLSDRGELHLLPNGCIGIADVGGGVANVTLVVGGAERRRVAGEPQGYFDRAVRSFARLAGARRIGPVLATGPFDWPTRTGTAAGALLVGDAAGYYDPFTGQGIFRALRGAELASEAADGALRSGDLSADAFAAYERARRRAFDAGVRVQHLIEAVVARPWLMSLAARRLRRRPRLADAVVAVTSDLRPVRSMLEPALLAQLVV